MGAVNDFLSIEPVKSAAQDFLSINPKTATEDFLSIEPEGLETPKENTETRKTLLSPEAQTAVGKVIAKGMDFWHLGENALKTEGEKLIIHAIDKTEQTGNYLDGIKKRMDGLDFMKVLMTPMGQYYARIGAKIPNPSTIAEKIAPQVFELPENWDSPLQYPPWVSTFIKSVGGEPNAAVSKIAQLAFVDGLSFHGLNAVLGKIMPSIEVLEAGAAIEGPSQLTQDIANNVAKQVDGLSKFSREGLVLHNRELALGKKVSKWNPEASTTGDPLSGEVSPEFLNLPKVRPKPIEENVQIINGVKYSMFDGQKSIAQPIKYASKYDELMARKVSSIENEIPEFVIPKDLDIKEILPEPGQVERPWTLGMRIKQSASWVMSPHNYARPVFDQVSLHKRTMEQLGREGTEYVSKFFGKFSEEQLNALGAVKDKISGYEVINKNWASIFGDKSDEAVKALEAYRAGWNYWKKTLGLSEDQAIKDYLPHIVKFYQDRDLPMPLELEMAIKNPKKFLKRRYGATNYLLNIEDLYKIYNGWAARYVATERFRGPILGAIEKVRELNPEYAAMARTYALNYFGEFRKLDETMNRLTKVSGTVGKTLSDGLIANNYASALANITQGPYFGFSALGHHWIKGVQLAGKATFGTSEEAAKWRKVWMMSGLEEAENTAYYKEASSLADMAIQKVLGHKAMQTIDEISYAGMRMTETINKKPMYLGAYNKAEQIANKVIKNPGKHKVWEQWLKENGIDITKELDTELYKYAHFETVKAMQDYSRAGQNLMNILPGVSAFMRIANFPLRAGETVLTNATKAGSYMVRAFSRKDPMLLRTALLMPETGATLRFGVMTTIGLLSAKAMGIDANKIIGLSNFVVTSSPLMSVSRQIIKGYQAYEEQDPQWVKKNLRSLGIMMGFKLTAPAFQLARFIETANANRWNTSGKWTIYSGNPNSPHTDIIDQVDPLWFAFSILSPIQFDNMDEYKTWIKENAKKQRIIGNLQKQIDNEEANYNFQKAMEIQNRRQRFQEQQALEKEKLLQRNPEMEVR
jgi:hypothetical protein